MRIKNTPKGAIPVFTKDELQLLRKTAKLMSRVSERLEEHGDAANDDMAARASMVVNDIEEFDTAVGDAKEGL